MSENKSHVAWLSGGYHARRAMLAKIREKLAGYDTFESDENVSFEYLMTKIQGTGCFSEKQLVIIHHMPMFKDSNKQKYMKLLKEAVERLDPDIYVVFNGIEKEKSLFAVVQKVGKVFESPDRLDRKEASPWVIEMLRKRGFSIDFSIADALVENCGFDASINAIGVDMLHMAIERLIACSRAGKGQISMEDFEVSVFEHQNFVIWDMLNAVEAKDYQKCLNVLGKIRMLDSNVPQAVASVMNTLLWRFRLLIFLKDRMVNDKDQSSVANSALSIRKLKRTGVGDHAAMSSEPFKTGEMAGQPQTCWNKMAVQSALSGMYGRTAAIEIFSRRDIYRIMRAILHAISNLRTVTSEGEALLLADTVFMTACKVGDDKEIKQIMNAVEKAQS